MAQPVLRFENEDHIKRFTAGIGANSNVGTALEHLTIVFRHAYPLRHLRGALELAPNLTDLILLLPAPFPHRLLEGLIFVNLRLLKTNLPHGRIVTLLSVNTTVRFLDLGPCGKSKDCPLRVIDLSRIPDIRCPIECCTAIVHPGATRVRMDLTRPRTAVSPILRSFPVRFIAVYVLSLQFTAMDDDLLSSIARFAPMVRVLRLWERADYGVCHRSLFRVSDAHLPQEYHSPDPSSMDECLTVARQPALDAIADPFCGADNSIVCGRPGACTGARSHL